MHIKIVIDFSNITQVSFDDDSIYCCSLHETNIELSVLLRMTYEYT
jgi:hypothetical protein